MSRPEEAGAPEMWSITFRFEGVLPSSCKGGPFPKYEVIGQSSGLTEPSGDLAKEGSGERNNGIHGRPELQDLWTVEAALAPENEWVIAAYDHIQAAHDRGYHVIIGNQDGRFDTIWVYGLGGGGRMPKCNE